MTFANIKVVIAVIIISFICIIFPIFLNINLFFSKNLKKLFFSLSIFKIIKFGGYVEKIKEGFAIHFSEKSAIIVPYKSLFGMGKTIKPLQDYHFIKLKTLLEIGDKEQVLLPMTIGFLINYFNMFLDWFLFNRKPYLDLDNKVSVYEGEDVFNVYLNVLVVFNLLMVLISILKILVGKIIYAIGSKKQQNKQGN